MKQLRNVVDGAEGMRFLTEELCENCTAVPNTGPGLPNPTGHEPSSHVHYTFIDKQDNTCYMHGSLPSAHTPAEFVLTIYHPLTYTNTNDCSVFYRICIAPLINCNQSDDGHKSIGRNM